MKLCEKQIINVDNYVDMVDFSHKLVQKFSTKSMFERVFLVEKLQKIRGSLKAEEDIM